MSPLRLIILLVAAGAAIAAVFLVRSVKAPAAAVAAAAPIEQKAAVPTKQILVAKKELTVGHFLIADDLRWQDWPENAQTPSFINKKDKPDALEKAVGAVVKFAMTEGEPLIETKFVHPGEGGFMSAMLDPGKRAVSIEISAETAAGGFVQPNDRVDVIVTRDIETQDAQKGGLTSFPKVRAQTIMENVRVIAIDAIYGPPATKGEAKQGEGAVVIGTRAVLELNENDTTLISAAQKAGRLSLSLRSVADLANPSGATQLGKALRQSVREDQIRVYRYGAENVAAVQAN